MAADYIRNLRDEVRKGFYGRLKQGLYPLPAPLGYLNRGSGKPKVHDPDRAPLVRQMFELYASGRYTMDTLRREMVRRGLANRAGGPLSRSATAWVLHNPFYIGIIRIERTGETFQGIHEPLITKRIFDRVQSVASGRWQARTATHEYAFRRLIYCVTCGYVLTGERQKGHVYYRCHTPACVTSLREDRIEERVRAVLPLFALGAEEMQDLRDIGDEGDVWEVEDERSRRVHLKRALALCEQRIAGLADALVDKTMDAEAYNIRNAQLLAERRGLLDTLRGPSVPAPTDDLLSEFELGNTAYVQFDSPNPNERREIVQRVTSNLVAEGKELAITLRSPYAEIANARLVQSGGPHCATARNGSTHYIQRLKRSTLRNLLTLTESGDAAGFGPHNKNEPKTPPT